MQRKLTAILSADVVGYSRMMELDEAGTLERLKANRKAIFDPRVTAHAGRVVKLMGDGALIEFTSIVAAVACALEVQSATLSAEQARPDDERIRYRIGVNLGDVIVEGDDIYGEGVNVAARLQTLAQPGGIAVSRTVRDYVSGKVAAEFEDMGEHSIKNLERPVHAFGLRVRPASVPPRAAEADGKRAAICVLPFANMSGDPEQEYFADGVTEDIITDLSKVSSLFVVSRNTAFTFKKKSIDVGQIAHQLKVSHILEGSVRKSGGRVRITAQLIDGQTDGHVWAERYDRDLSDIFALQDEISEAIVRALKLKLLPEEKRAIEQRSTTNPMAYKLYLMARQYAAKRGGRQLAIAERICKRVVQLDPDDARAWALLAYSQSDIFATERQEGGRVAAERALALDPSLPEAHTALSRVLTEEGRHEEARAEVETALRLDPQSYHATVTVARSHLMARRFADALTYFEKAASLDENEFWALSLMIQCHEAIGDEAGARSAARRALARIEKRVEADTESAAALAYGVGCLARLGEPERARDWAERAALIEPDNQGMTYNLACSMIKLGELEVALDLLDNTFHKGNKGSVAWAEADTDLDALRDHPRFRRYLAEAHARLAVEGATV